ncbi:MAG: type II toxin-antitoxin system Phd/YefM family antitoxin [Acidobacteria bacterium]|nr:type II toxin-antitoxin system Phd/YefM family antitoxin [Acidobacteriota bacterium]
MRAELATTLKRHTTELLEEVEREKEPILITRRGLPSVYLVDAETWEWEQHRMKVMEGIARGERAIEQGDTMTHEQFKKRMAKWLK